jgi:uncharacterized protein (TIGR03032 family)
MGLAVRPDRIAVATQSEIWTLRDSPELAPRLAPSGSHEAAFLARQAHFTGDIQAHEIAFGSGPPALWGQGLGQSSAGFELWIVNTLFSCLCTLHEDFSFVPRWRPTFISSLVAEDRCHMNGMALQDGRPRYVTALGETDSPQGWRPEKASSGCVIDVDSGAIVARGLAMPHSPRLAQGRLWALDSGRGHLVLIDPASGRLETVARLPGYTRGLALHGPAAFVGLSKIRESSTFGGLPIAESRSELKCGVAAVELGSERRVALLEFQSGIDEIFDVQVLPGVRFPALSGPRPEADGAETIWCVPEAREGFGASRSARP